MNTSPAAMLALALLAVSGQGAAQESVAAVWKEHELFFSYRSSVVVYTCSALEERVARILRAVGARPDLRVSASNCSDAIPLPDPVVNEGGRWGAWEPVASRSPIRHVEPRQFANVSVRLMMPVEVTPDILDELEKDRSRRELVSRVTGNPAARFDDPIAFTAQHQLVTLSRKTIDLESEDCELLDQMSTSGFRELGIRVVRRGYVCNRDRVSRLSPQLEVEALIGTPYGFSNAEPPPAAGKDEADPGSPPASDEKPADPSQ